MRKKKLRLAALILALAVLLSACGLSHDLLKRAEEYAWELLGVGSETVEFSDMEYTQPDMDALRQALRESCEIARTETDADKVLEAVYAFYDVYDRFYTDLALADIHYSSDLTDLYWEKEYNFCLENVAEVDAALEELYYTLAESPVRDELESDFFGEGFFLSYEDENIWNKKLLAMMEEENRLIGRYYELSSEAMEEDYYSEEYFSAYLEPMTELLVEQVSLRQQIAENAGYPSYGEFAYDFYHYRDYSPRQAERYLEEIGQKLTELYRSVNVSGIWKLADDYCDEDDTFRYVKTAANNMGGKTQEAFSVLEKGDLYHIAYGKNKMDGSFETYLWSYYQPFVFVSPYLDQTDKLAFAHEFGHFVNDYVCYGSTAGTDVAEVHSQAMEYLSLCYAEDAEELEAYKMADCLCVYVEQAAYALFEQRLYELQGDELTAENVQALYKEIGTQFGFDSWDWDPRDFITVEHFYTNPMYIISYVVSNDTAFQIYQLEREESGAGLAVYEQCVESMDSYLVEFAKTYGLESPFRKGRIDEVLQTLETELADYIS